MLGGMSRLASLAVVLLGATAPTWGAPAPKGRVVRVERPRGNNATIPILCEVKSDGSGVCVGKSPEIGETILVVDDAHTVAEVRVTKTEPLSPKCETLWNITTEITRGDLSQVRANKTIGMIDPSADPRAARRVPEDRLTSPSPNPDVRVLVGIDRDGDGTADVVATQYSCDAQGQPTSANARSMVDYCIDIWSRRDNVMKRAWTTKFQACRP